MFDRITPWIHRNLPTREQIEGSRWTRPFANRILRSELWRFTRRSVPRGVALGMLVGIIVPFAQILFAALLCWPVRANVPVAALTTFITNPFTTPLIWILGYNVGAWLLRIDAMTVVAPVNRAMERSEFGDMLQWLTDASLVTAFGLVVVGIVAAAVSYLVTGFVWRFIVAGKRKRKLHERRARRERPAAPAGGS